MGKPYNPLKLDRNDPKKHRLFAPIYAFLCSRAVAPPYKIDFKTCKPDEPCVIVANHAGAWGPIIMCTKFKIAKKDPIIKFRPWVISYMLYMKTAPWWVREDLLSGSIKSPWSKFWVWVFSFPLALVAQVVFYGIEAIPAHFDKNAVFSINKSVETLKTGISVLIFPETRKYFSPYLEDLNPGFPLVARQYYKKTGKKLLLYPSFSCQENCTITVGEPIRFDPEADFKAHSEEIRTYLRDEMVKLAREVNAPEVYKAEDYDPKKEANKYPPQKHKPGAIRDALRRKK